MAERICAMPECEKPHLARGLCGTHYNQQHQPNRHAKVTVSCGYCGVACEKHPSAKYAKRFCSLICRDLDRLEQTDGDPFRQARAQRLPRIATRLPDDHPARWYGDTSAVQWSECAWCGQMFCHRPLAARAYCQLKCKARAHHVRRRAHENPLCFGQWSWSDFMHMARRFNYRCAYCGNKPDRLDPDHVTPVSRGGPNILANLLPACMPCNSDKRDLLLNEWAADRDRRGLIPRCTTWADEDTRYWHLSLPIAA